MSTNNPSPVIRSVFRVKRKEYITPHYIRVYLTGDDVGQINETTIGANNKILVPPPGVPDIHFPTIDPSSGATVDPPEHLRPRMRTYTHRGIDLERNLIWIDFVAHGDEGPASAWAIAAQPGDQLGVMMKRFKKELVPERQNYLLIGDATAIPVLCAILEALSPQVKARVVIEVAGPEDEQTLTSAASMEVTWLHNPQPQMGSTLAEHVRSLDLPASDRFAYIAAEYGTVKELRNYFRKDQEWTAQELYAYSYWKSGEAEDKSATDRRKESVVE